MTAPLAWATQAQTELTAVCAKAPPGMNPFKNDIEGYVRWGVLVLIAVSALVSLGSILAGRIFNSPHASRFGAAGLAVVVIVAILLVTVGGFLNGIVGRGCG